MIARRVVVRGRVQGVGYRYSTVEAAERYGITGWVRNRRDGTVEALIQGETAAVLAMLDWCRRGPPGARVEAVDAAEIAPDSAVVDFTTVATL